MTTKAQDTTTTPTPATPRKGRRPMYATMFVSALLVPALGAAGYRYLKTYHLVTVREGVLYRSGNRTAWEYENTIRRVRPKTVVCVVDDKEVADPAKPQFAAGEAYLRQQGVQYVHIPVKLGGWP